ncbi:MAG: carboxyl transferase [Lachnospiraceae bacterium]|nr:carboxyl transferase [Lachnospiraceae bacterium]
MSGTSKALGRIASLLDDSSFAEIGALVTARSTDLNTDPKALASDGCVTGYGTIGGRCVYVYSQDASVLGGSIGEMHARKIVNLYDMAIRTGSPVIGIVDCAGMRLEEGSDALYAFGRIYGRMTKASGVIPQITAVVGNCGGGAGLFSGLSDFTFISKDGKLFVNAPDCLAGNYTAKNDTAGAAFQSEIGNADSYETEAELFAAVRQLVSVLPSNNETSNDDEQCTDDLNRLLAVTSASSAAALVENIGDAGSFVEVRSKFAPSVVTAFVKLDGVLTGVVANNAEVSKALTADACDKAADFVKFCDAFDIQILSLTNVNGFDNTVENEKRIARSAAALAAGFASATVPKVNVIVGDAIGNAANIMNAKALGCDMTISWDNAKVGIMDGKLASQITGTSASDIDAGMSGACDAARRGYVDQVISAADTRKYVIAAFEMLYSKSGEVYKKHTSI